MYQNPRRMKGLRAKCVKRALVGIEIFRPTLMVYYKVLRNKNGF
jgi:hypothetical protein